jgi:uncharacterized glyoxalase superfamily protein PhnB
MPTTRQRIIPMLAYEDAAAAAEWLCDAFGFEEDASVRHTESDGTVTHAELSFGGAKVMLATPNKEYRSPRHHSETCAEAAAWLDNPWVIDGVWVEVDGLDAHVERARAAGATILSEPEQGPVGPQYRVEDPEGHRWMFAQASA